MKVDSTGILEKEKGFLIIGKHGQGYFYVERLGCDLVLSLVDLEGTGYKTMCLRINEDSFDKLVEWLHES